MKEIDEQTNEYFNKLIEMSKEIILKFVTDKFGRQDTNHIVANVMDELRITYVSENEIGSDIVGIYQKPSKVIAIPVTINRNNNLLSNLGTIIHEISHALSDQVAKGGIISNEIEEGFADIFSSECLNYFLQKSPEKLEMFAKKENKKYDKNKIYAPSSDYIGERDFVSAILEAIRQTTGKHYDAEFEYLLGDKNKFLEIVQQTLGDEGLELLMQQSRDNGGKKNLGMNYNYSYNERLIKILEKMSLQYKGKDQKREDGTYNVYNLSLIHEAIEQKEAVQLLHSLEQQLQTNLNKNLTNEMLNSIVSQASKKTINAILDYLVNSKTLGIEYVFQTVSNDVFYIEDLNLTDEQRKLITSKIQGIKAENLSEDQIQGLIKICATVEKPDEHLNQLLKDIEQQKIENPDIQLGLKIAKIKTDKETNGHMLTDLLETFCSVPNDIEISQDLTSQILPIFYSYLENCAKYDSKVLKTITDFLAQIESKANGGEELSDKECIYYPLRDKFVELISRDIYTIQNTPTDRIHIEKFEQIDVENIFGNNVMDNIKILPFEMHYPLTELLHIDFRTKFIPVFNENVIAQCIDGRLLESAMEEFEGLNEVERSKYMEVFVSLLEKNPNEISSVEAMKKMCMSIIPYATSKDPKVDSENKMPFIQLIKQNIQQRQNPLVDLKQLYEYKIPEELQFMYDEMINLYQEMYSNGKLNTTSENLIRQLVLAAPKNEKIAQLSSDLLSKQYTDMGLTTESFMQNLATERAELHHEYIYEKLTKEDLTKWIKFRTIAYMKSIGKSGNELQENALFQLQNRVLQTEKIMLTPQYVEYNKSNGTSNYLIVGRDSNNTFITLEPNGDKIEPSEEISNQQNRGKKGILALFKKKKDKELVTETMIISKDGNTIQAINRYETGRLEIVSIDARKNKKVKVLDRKDLVPQDIGNNGSLVTSKPVVEKVDISAFLGQERESTSRDSTDKISQNKSDGELEL